METQPQLNNLQTKNPTPTQQSTNWKPQHQWIGNQPNNLQFNPTNYKYGNLKSLQITQSKSTTLWKLHNKSYTHNWSSEKIRVLHIFIIEALCPLGFGYLHIQQTTETLATKRGNSTIRVSIQASWSTPHVLIFFK